MPEAAASGTQFDIAKVRVLIEGVDKASAPIQKVKNDVEDLSKKQKEIFPEKVMETMHSGWTKVALAIGAVATATYGLTRISPIFGSYVQMFFQSLGALMDQFIIPLMPAFDWIIDKMWKFVGVAETVVKTLSSMYHEAKQFVGLEPKDTGQGTEGLEMGEAGRGIGGLIGGVLGGLAGRQAVRGLGAAGMKLPGWQGKLVGGTLMIAGGLAGADVGEQLERSETPVADVVSSFMGAPTAGKPSITGGGFPGAQNIVTLNFYVNANDPETVLQMVERKLREALKGVGAGSGAGVI